MKNVASQTKRNIFVVVVLLLLVAVMFFGVFIIFKNSCSPISQQQSQPQATRQPTVINNFIAKQYVYIDGVDTETSPAPKKNILSACNITEESSMEQRVVAAMQFFITKGYSVEASAGIVGNLITESTLDPYAISDLDYMGLAQWNTNEEGAYWWTTICDWSSEHSKDVFDFLTQLEAITDCPRRGFLEEEDIEELKNIKCVEQATEMFACYYEVCPADYYDSDDVTDFYEIGSCYQSLGLRKREAWQAYNLFTGVTSVYTGERPYQRY